MAKVGRKGLYDEWLDDDHLLLISGWCREGATDKDIAEQIGISQTTFYDWKNRFPKFAAALKINKAMADFMVENALYKAALEGNTTAQIFWLKNRKVDQWRDKPKESNDADDNKLLALIQAIKES